jgi:hypothetical protein
LLDGEGDMHLCSKTFLALFQLGILVTLGAAGTQAQTVTGSASLALKSGESATVGDVYYVANCKSLLKSPPEAEVLDGPPGVTATIKEAMVLPRLQKCANRVSGGTLVITANDIEETSYGPLTIRITYRTRDGDRKLSQVFNLSLFP